MSLAPGQASYGQPYHDDLLKEIIPFVEANYSVLTDLASRGIGGMSMGSGQALNIGLTNLDEFDWIAVVAPAPNTWPPAELLADTVALNRLKLFWLSVGNRDALYRVAQGVHNLATEKGVRGEVFLKTSSPSPTQRAPSVILQTMLLALGRGRRGTLSKAPEVPSRAGA